MSGDDTTRLFLCDKIAQLARFDGFGKGNHSMVIDYPVKDSYTQHDTGEGLDAPPVPLLPLVEGGRLVRPRQGLSGNNRVVCQITLPSFCLGF